MRRHLLIVLALGVCAWAAADVRLFVTNSASGYGLDLLGPQGDGTGTDPAHENWPIDPFRPTYSTVSDYGSQNEYAYDYHFGYYRVGAYPPITAPSGTADNPILINAAAGEWGYIWFQFRNEPQLSRVNEMTTVATLAGESQPTQDLSLTYYVQNDYSANGSKRWFGDATAPGYPEWRDNPQHFIVINERGITNGADDPQMMFHHQAGTKSDPGWTGVALLGALRGTPTDAVYELQTPGAGYTFGQAPSIGESCFFRIVPEPASALLLAVAAVSVGLRRRRF